MVRPLILLIVGVALLTTMAFPPLFHLHVAQNQHHHSAGASTHEHQARVHAHGTSHQPTHAAPSRDTSADLRQHDHGPIVTLDTMLTEMPDTTGVFAVVRTAAPLPASDHVAGRYPPREPRAHGPPGIRSGPSRAPPA